MSPPYVLDPLAKERRHERRRWIAMVQKVRSSRALVLTLLDQTLSSGTNFLVAVAALALLPIEEYSKFGIAVAVALGLLAVIRSSVIEPTVVKIHRSDSWNWRDASEALGTLVLPFFAAGMIAAVVFRGTIQIVAFALIALPGLSAFELNRYRMFSLRQPNVAATMDAVWLLMSATLLAGVSAGSLSDRAAVLFTCWALPPAAISLYPSMERLRFRYIKSLSIIQARHTQGLVVDTVIETLSLWGLLGLANWASIETGVATFNAGRTIFGLLTVFTLAVPLIYSAVDLSQIQTVRRRVIRVWLSPSLALSVVCLLILSVAIRWGDYLPITEGGTWSAARPILLQLGAYNALYALAQLGRQQVRYFGNPRLLMRLRLVVFICLMASPAVAVSLSVDRGLAFANGLVVGAFVAATVWLSGGLATITSPKLGQ